MAMTAKFALGSLCFVALFILSCDFPERPTVLTISNAPVFRPSNPNDVKTIEQVLSAVITVVQDDLRLPTVDPLTVYTYKNNLSFALFGPGREVSIDTFQVAAGAKGNEMHVKMTAVESSGVKNLPLGHFLEVFAHEYAHNLHYTISANPPPVPKWFSEGFAGWVAANVLHSLGWQEYKVSLHRALREVAYHRDILLGLSSLDDPKIWSEQLVKPKGAIRTYVLATIAVNCLIQKEGLAAVMNYFKTGVFVSSFRISWEDFARDFDRYISETGVQKMVPFKTNKPDWKIGYTWLYARKVPGKTIQLQREVGKESLYRNEACFVVKEGGQEILVTKGTLSQVQNMQDGKVIWRADKPNLVMNWPLEQGKKWRNIYKFEDFQRGTSGVSDRLMVVPKVETIRVSAGVFDTAKVEAYDSETGRLVAEYWYSPEVKWMVKVRWYDVSVDGFREDELVSFKVED